MKNEHVVQNETSHAAALYIGSDGGSIPDTVDRRWHPDPPARTHVHSDEASTNGPSKIQRFMHLFESHGRVVVEKKDNRLLPPTAEACAFAGGSSALVTDRIGWPRELATRRRLVSCELLPVRPADNVCGFVSLSVLPLHHACRSGYPLVKLGTGSLQFHAHMCGGSYRWPPAPWMC
jgi:hypothetical protein